MKDALHQNHVVADIVENAMAPVGQRANFWRNTGIYGADAWVPAKQTKAVVKPGDISLRAIPAELVGSIFQDGYEVSVSGAAEN